MSSSSSAHDTRVGTLTAFAVANGLDADALLSITVFLKLQHLALVTSQGAMTLEEIGAASHETRWELLAKCVELERLELAGQGRRSPADAQRGFS